jgi:hypothetical protein
VRLLLRIRPAGREGGELEMTNTIAIILLTASGLMAADKDNSQRMEECAAQAEKAARQDHVG